jgi:TRAP-type C4-dicarboxylate transport system permease small subunit
MKLSFAVSAIGLLSLIGLITISVLMRWLFNMHVVVAEEYGGYFLVVITYWGAYLAFETDSFVRVSLIYDRYGEKLGFVVNIIFYLMFIAFLGFVCFYTCREVWDAFRFQTVSWTVAKTPIVIPKAFMFVGMVVLEINLLLRFVLLISGKEKK